MPPNGLPPEDPDRRAALLAHLRAAADPDGFVPYDRFLDLALYSDDAGFYSRPGPVLGTSGDFYTAAHVHPLFAETIAARALEIRGRLDGPAPFRLVDLGAGDGTLVAGIARVLAGRGERGWEVTVVDRSERLRETARARATEAVGDSELPVRAASSVAELGPFAGVVVANELFDAQPVRRLRREGGGWRELGVRVEEGRLRETTSPIVPPVPGPALGEAPDGTVVEVSPAGEAIVRELADHLELGAAILLDFGMDEEELRRGHPSGTLAAVHHHVDADDPLGAAGRADLSTFVNFTRLRSVAQTAGLVELAYQRQAEALGRWGFSERLAEGVRAAASPEAEVRLRLAAKNLLFGFDRFRALELASRSAADRLRSVR